MNTEPPAPGRAPSQRTLAAIVFTDVVSFSARMHTDEVGTLKLLQRDFAEMRRLCAEHEGEVLKTTGDGLLLTFTSAVQAVACALAMQRQFAAEAKDLAAGTALQHRIGIHLGDVLVQDKDVMGDGVNIASRIQSEAEPGGICISQTVYDVVKNKLQMQVVSLGARDLKNIAQAMPVYRLLLEAQALGPGSRPPFQPAGGATKPARRGPLIAGVAAAALVAVAAGFALFHHRSGPAVAPAPPPAASTPAPTPAPAAVAPAAAGAATTNLASELENEVSSRKDFMADLHARFLDKYDFNGLVLELRDKGESPSAPIAVKRMLRSAEQLVRLKTWLDAALLRHSRQNPLVVHDLPGGAAKDVSVFMAADQRVVFVETGSTVPRDWADLKPPVVGAIIVGAIRSAKEPPRAVLPGAQAFARLYGLPQMAKELASVSKEPAAR
jgi:class 3 adenylate cyclase